jgi:glycosyltransferase involved in cell wall biosynthesis
MRVTLLTGWLSKSGGGVFESVSRMAQSLRALPEIELSVLGLADKRNPLQAGDWNGVAAAALRTYGPSSWGYSPALLRRLSGIKPDLLHVHGLWMYSSVASRGWSCTSRRPYMVAPHGMLDPWAIRNSSWKKNAALWAYERQHLEGAKCLHALCDAEAEAIRAFGLRNPICIVPNSIDVLDPVADPPANGDRSPIHTLLFLGRLHPKKGLVNLLNAWHRFDGRRDLAGGAWELVIAGWDQGGHEKELRDLVDRLQIRGSVRFPGPTFGAEKASMFRTASAFILPSLSEGLPMAVLEAWSYGLPVVMTPQCNFADELAAGASLCVEANSEDILQGLRRLARMDDGDRRKMGAVGLKLCREHFSPAPISDKMAQIYRWVTARGPRPQCVHMD